MQACFNALKYETHNIKLKILNQALEKDMNRQLIAANAFLHDKSVELQAKYKRQSCEVMKSHLSKFVYCYFQKWKRVYKLFKVQVNTKLRDRVLARYKRYVSSYFFWWKAQKDKKKYNLKDDLCRKIEIANDEYYKVSVLQDRFIRDKISALKTD
jgi:murein L,D-transpeptidase YafK